LADPLVRIMPDKRNDQIVSSPKEENTSPTLFIKINRRGVYFEKGAALLQRSKKLFEVVHITTLSTR
jgi:hypothetical protein